MTIPDAFDGKVSNVHYYQSVIIAQVAVTLVIYIVLRILWYVKWGYIEQPQAKQKPPGQAASEQPTSRKWDQKQWDIHFPIIYTNHLAALAFSLCFIPYIFEAIVAYIHFACFIGIIIVNIFIQDAEAGNGNRSKVTRILWLIMCIMNILQIIAGLTGVVKVLG